MAKRGNEISQAAQERFRQERDAQIVTQSCAWCPDWSETGPLGEVRELFLAHRLEEHPEVVPKARFSKRRGAPRTGSSSTLDQNINRARTHGAAGWVSQTTS